MKVKLTEAERYEFFRLWKDQKLHISEVIIRTEEFMSKVLERLLREAA